MSTLAERMTADEYLDLEDPRRTELIDGIVVVSEPAVLHQHVFMLLLVALLDWTREASGRGFLSPPLNVPLDRYNVLAPDLLWFAEDVPLTAVNAPRVPDLAVEVRSPSSWRYDIGRKRDLYEQHGVRELWLADTASRTMLVYRRAEREPGFAVTLELAATERLTSPLLPGFDPTVGDLLPHVE
jgi:Uma2 family endonuclease